jgi:hypothetical protein
MVDFPLIDPAMYFMNSNEITHVYVWPDNVAIAIDFAADATGSGTRQDYVEIYQAPWVGGDSEDGIR